MVQWEKHRSAMFLSTRVFQQTMMLQSLKTSVKNYTFVDRYDQIYSDNNDKVFTNVETSEISNQTTIRNSILSKKHKF